MVTGADKGADRGCSEVGASKGRGLLRGKGRRKLLANCTNEHKEEKGCRGGKVFG